MPIRTTISLVLSAYYGLFILVSFVPILVVAITVITMLGIVPLGAPGLGILFGMLLLASICAQSARTAASISGLQSFSDQPDFKASVIRSLSAVFLIVLFAGAGIFGLVTVMQGQGGDASVIDAEKIGAALKATLKTPATLERTASVAGMASEPSFFIAVAAAMVLLTFSAMMVVPRATNLDGDYGRAYSLGLIFARLVIALPFCGVLTLIIVNVVLSAIEVAVGFAVPDYRVTIAMMFFAIVLVFSSMMFMFEAYLLIIGKELGLRRERKQRAIEREDKTDYRALRQAWSQQG